MAYPSSYTEETLADYMHRVLADLSETLNWSVATGSYEEPVNEALAVYGTDDISEITTRDELKRLRAIARVELWWQVVRTTAGDYDFSADGGSYNRSQVNKMAREQLALEEAAAMAYGLVGYEAVIDTVRHKHDPYQYLDDDVRTP